MTTRAPKPTRRMGTETIADRRTRRSRQRGQEERAVLEAELEEEADFLEALCDMTEEWEDDEWDAIQEWVD